MIAALPRLGYIFPNVFGFSIALISLNVMLQNVPLHYANMSVQYTAIFHGCKNGNFQMKKCENFIIFAQNIDRGYTLEPSR